MITYGSTTLTSYNTITKIEVYYYQSTSSTSQTGGSWSTNEPTWVNGRYVWQKTRTYYEGKVDGGTLDSSTGQYYVDSSPVNITGQKGQTGTAAYSYKLNASDTSITVSKDGTYSKTKVTFSATYKQGTSAVTAYAGRFKIETTANGTTWTTQYTSSANESSKEYTIPTGILNIRCSLYQAGGTSVLLDIVSVAIVTDGKDGTNGTNGLNNARVILYRRFNAAPSGTDIAPTGNVTYTFSTGVAANNLNSWTQNIPTGTNPVYMIAASASNTGATDTIAKTEWSAPIKILENGQNGTNGTNGTNGIDGYNQATIYLYQRKSGTAPSKPSSAVTYTFSTGALSSVPTGWSRTIPTNDGNPCYVTTATAVAKTTTYSIPASGWSDVVILSQDGEDGTSITITSTSVKYQKGTSGTAKPTGTWGTTIPSLSENEFLWTQTIVNYSDGSSTEAYSVSRNAKNGTNGTSPTVSSTVVEYQQSTGGTTPPTGTWNSTAPTATAGQYMWTKTTITYSDGKTAVSYSVSKNGANGIDGIDGTSQNLLLDVYASSLTKVKAPWDRYLSDANNTTITGEFIAESNLPDPNATHFYRITDSSASTKGRAMSFYNGGTPPFLDGHTYRIGCWVRNHAGQPKVNIYLGGIQTWTNSKIITSTEWQWIECVHTFGDTDPSINTHSTTYKRLYFYFYNNNVAGSSLDMCGFKVEEIQTDISTARNILLKTEKLENWGTANGASISDGIAIFPDVTSDTVRRIYSTNFKYELIRNQNVILSIRVKADIGKMCVCNLYMSLKTTEDATSSSKWFNNYVYFTGNGEWKTICVAVPVSDELFSSGTGTPDYDNCWASVGFETPGTYHNGYQLKQPQLSLGTTATAWSAAPEDVDANIQQVQNNLDNLEIGGRNLVRDTADWKNCPYAGDTATVSGEEFIAATTTGTNWRRINGWFTKTKEDIYSSPIVISFDVKKSDNTPVSELVFQLFTTSKAYKEQTSGNLPEGSRYYISLANSIWKNTENVNKDTWTRVYSIPIIMQECFNTTSYTEYDYLAFYIGVKAATGSASFRHLKIELGNKATDWTPAPEDTQADIDTALAQSIEYIIGTQTAATGNWTGVSSSLTELKDGTQIKYWLPYAGSGNASLNLTLKDGTSTGAIPIYRQGGSYNTTSKVVVANRVTTHFPAGTSISMVYGVNRVVSAVSSSVTYTGTFTGWFADGAYDSGNTYNRTRMQNAITAATAITAGRIICGTNSGYKNIGANIAFDLSYPLLYASSAISASATGDNNYLQINGIGASNNGTITSGAAKKELYLKGTVSGNTFTISASPFMTTVVPTSADGFYYIPLGLMYSASAIYFTSSNRLYAYIDGAFQPVDTAAVLRAQDAKNLATAVYGTCSTAAGTATKSVACNNFVLFNGARIQVTFTYANTYANTTSSDLALNVNNTGAKPIYINKTKVSATNQLLWGAGSKMEFVYDGTGWVLQNAPFSLYGTCSTASATANKEVTCNEAVICKASVIYIKMTYSNTATSAKLNVASTGEKTIKANGADLQSNSRFNWNAGATIAFTFDGQYWNMSDDTITAYVTDTSDDGIMVHPVNDQNTGWSIGNSIQLLKNSISYIKLWLENSIAKIRIGEEDKGHIIINNNSVDVMNNTTCLASFGSTSTIGRSEGAHLEQSSGGLKVVDADGSNQVTFGAQSATVTWESATTIVPASTSDSNIVQIDLPTELASDQNMTLTIGTATYTIPTKQTYSYTHADYTISYDGAYLVQVTNLSTSDLNIALDYPITQPTNYGITATTPNNTRIKARVYTNNQVVAEGGIYANDAGNFGLFDTKRAKWMIVSTSDGTVKIPSLTPKLLYAKKVYANTTQFQWNYMDIQLKQWAVIAVRANVNNVTQYLLFFSPASGSSQHLSDRPGQTVYVRGGFKVDWAQNKIYVRWTEGGSSYAQYVFIDQVIGLVRK